MFSAEYLRAVREECDRLINEKEQLDRAIAALEEVLSHSGRNNTVTLELMDQDDGRSVRTEGFSGLRTAIRDVLAKSSTPLLPREVTRILRDRGFPDAVPGTKTKLTTRVCNELLRLAALKKHAVVKQNGRYRVALNGKEVENASEDNAPG